MKTSEKISYCAMLVALAMIFSYVESMIPINFGIPGVKIGIANVVTVFGIYFLNSGSVFLIVFLRIILIGFMFGSGMSILYSLAGGMLSLIVMLLMKKTGIFSVIGVSIGGGIAHNVGQIAVAAGIVQNLKLIYYLPVLLISGTITGWLIGIISSQVLKSIKGQSIDMINRV